MVSFEEAMAVAQTSIENSSEEWVRLEEYPLNLEYSEDETVDINIESKTIGDLSANVSTTGEKNSQYIHFMMDRFYDGVDLTSMLIQVQYQYPNGGGNVNGPINVYANDSKIKFGWVVPPEATRFESIQIIIYCIGVLSNGKPYIVKTLPAVYHIPETLSIEDVSVETDEGWYEQFATSMAEQVRTANEYANQAKNSAQNASDDLEDIQVIKVDVITSKNTVQTLAAQVQSNTTKAQASADAAKASETNSKESEEKAKQYYENTSAVSGIKIATQTTAGIIKGGENYIDESGELQLTKRTDSPTLYNSYAGGIKLNELGGVSEQDSTTGAQLLNYEVWKTLPITGGTAIYENNGVTLSATSNDAYTAYSEVHTPDNVKIPVSEGDIVTLSWEEDTNASGIIYIFGNGLAESSVNTDNASGRRNISYVVPSDITFVTMRFGVRTAGTTISYKNIMFNKTSEVLPWEPYTGGKASPNPDYPQEIKSVKGKNLLDCSGLVEKATANVIFRPVYDANGNLEYIEVNGTTNSNTFYNLNEKITLPAGTYIVSGFALSQYSMIQVVGSDGTTVLATSYENGGLFTLNEKTDVMVRVRINIGTELVNQYIYPMICPASIADPTYVPYGLLRILGHGKNLFNKDNLTVGNILQDGTHGTSSWGYQIIRCKEGETYTISGVILNGSAYFAFYDKDMNVINTVGSKEQTLVAPSGARYLGVCCITLETSANYNKDILMVEQSTEATPYEPYTEQSITLSEPIELNGIGDAKDRIVKKDGVWGIERRIRKFTGLQGRWERGVTNGVVRFYYWDSLIKPNTSNILCNYAQGNPTWTTIQLNKCSVLDNFIGLTLDSFQSFTTSAEVVSYLQSLEPKFYILYELATPTFEPLSTADQIALNSLKSFEGITYLYCDSEVQPTWDLEYGTSRVGGYTLECYNDKEVMKLEVAAMKAAQTTTEEVTE